MRRASSLPATTCVKYTALRRRNERPRAGNSIRSSSSRTLPSEVQRSIWSCETNNRAMASVYHASSEKQPGEADQAQPRQKQAELGGPAREAHLHHMLAGRQGHTAQRVIDAQKLGRFSV